MTGNVSTDRTQRITMQGRTYIFVASRHPELDGHDNLCVGHLLNSQTKFAGYVFVMIKTGARVLQRGPKGITNDQERAGLAMIVFSDPLQAMIGSRRTRLLATEALQAHGVPFTDRGPAGSIRILLPGWGDVDPSSVVDPLTGRISTALLRALEDSRTAPARPAGWPSWADLARGTVALAGGLTERESVALTEAVRVLEDHPDILAEWIKAARATS